MARTYLTLRTYTRLVIRDNRIGHRQMLSGNSHILHANIDATFHRKLVEIGRSDFGHLADECLTRPFYVSTAHRTRGGAKPTRESLPHLKEILIQELAPSICEGSVTWSFTIKCPTYTSTSPALEQDDPALVGIIESITILAESEQTGFRCELAVSEAEVELTLMAGLIPEKLNIAINATLARVKKHLAPSPVLGDATERIDKRFRLPSIMLSMKLLQRIENEYLKIITSALANKLACVRSLVATTNGKEDAYTYSSAGALAKWHKDFPPEVRDLSLCAWLFTSQTQGDSYVPEPELIKGVHAQIRFTKKYATLHVQGRAENVSALGAELHREILRIVADSETNCRFAHSRAIGALVMVFGVTIAITLAIVFEKHPGVIIAAGILCAISYSFPFAMPKLFPFVIFESAVTLHRRHAALWICRVTVVSIFIPIIVELLK